MVQIVYIGVWKTKPAAELCTATWLKSFNLFVKGTAVQGLKFSAKTVVDHPKEAQRWTVEEGEYNIHANQNPGDGFTGVMITDKDYPKLTAHGLLNKVVDEFIVKHPKRTWANSSEPLPFPELTAYIEKYQKPEEADPILKIQKGLDETKIVLHKTIESVLERGEKIDSLVAKSEELSYQSKAFYSQAKKQNSCCVVM